MPSAAQPDDATVVVRRNCERRPALAWQILQWPCSAGRIRSRILGIGTEGGSARRSHEKDGQDELPTLAEHDFLDGGDVLPGFRVPVSEVFRDLKREAT